MRKTILLCTLLVINFAQSQINNGTIKYNVFFSDNENNELFVHAKSMSDHLEYTLVFDKEGSLFNLEPKMIDDLGYNYARILAGDKILYQDLKDKTITYNNSDYSLTKKKNEFLLNDTIRTDWTLHNETKMIGNYQCFKATMNFETKNSKGTFQNPVTAWYCPQIPFGYGPNGYGTLPGLILELQVRDILYGAVKIDFNTIKNKVAKPTEGKKISKEEFRKISSERYKKLMHQ